MYATKNFLPPQDPTARAFLLCCLVLSPSLDPRAAAQELTQPAWLEFQRCPIRAEHRIDVPALESGVLEHLQVKLNDEVSEKQVIASLDADLAEMSEQLALLQLRAAQEVADDRSGIDLYELAVRQREEEYQNLQKIAPRVGAAEIREKKFEWEQAKVGLKRAIHAKQRAVVDAQLKSAGVGAAKLSLQRRHVRAPLSGVVTQVHKQPGQWVEPGEAIVQITDLKHLVVDRSIPVANSGYRSLLDAPAQVRVECGPQPILLPGRVSSFDHEVSAQGLIKIHVVVENVRTERGWAVLPGMNVTLQILNPHADQTLLTLGQVDNPDPIGGLSE